MEYTQLGLSDLNVSRICLGCMGFGDPARGQHSWTLDESSSRKIILHALDSGINFFDTAAAYQSGTSEEYLGRTLKAAVPRDKVVIATKFLPRTDKDLEDGIDGKQHIRNMLERSLRNLGTDYVDLYIYHMWDYRTSLEDIMEGLSDVVKAGLARYIGISNCFSYQLERANRLAELEGYPAFISVQNHYNLIFREEEREMAKLCREENIAMTPYSALAGGRLARRDDVVTKRLEEDTYARLKYDRTAEQDAIIIDRVAKLAAVHNTSMTAVSLSWLLTKVDAPVAGATRVEQIDGAVNSLRLRLSPEDIAYLEEPYVPHALVGVMAQNTMENAAERHVWSAGSDR